MRSAFVKCGTCARAHGDDEFEPTKLLEGEQQDSTLVHAGATGTATGGGTAPEALGVLNWTKKREGKAGIARNGWKGGTRELLREIARLIFR